MVYSPTEDLNHVAVDLLIRQVASIVLQGVFDADDGEDHQQRNHGDFLLKGLHHGDPVQQCQEQEIKICKPADSRAAG